MSTGSDQFVSSSTARSDGLVAPGCEVHDHWVNELLRLRLAANAGVLDAAELQVAGYDRHATRALVRGRELVRVRSGAFVDGERYDAGDAAARHVLEARTIVRRLSGYAVSHVSAAALWNLPVLSSNLDSVHLAQIERGRARSTRHLRVHPPVSALDVTSRAGVCVVVPALALLQTAEISMRAGVIAADGALRAGLTTRSQLLEVCETHRLGFAAHRVADLASTLSESPGESWTRLVLAGLGVDAAQQVEIRDESGRFVARVDFLVRGEQLIIEFDGAVKYAGADGRAALMREKHREDELRALGYRVVRLTWSDLSRPERVATKLALNARIRSK